MNINEMKRKASASRNRDFAGFTRKERQQNLRAGLAKMGVTDDLAQANIEDFINVGTAVAKARRTVVPMLLDDYDPNNPEAVDYIELLMREVSTIEGGTRPVQKPRIIQTIPLVDFDWGSLRASIESAQFSEDVKAALALALADAAAAEALAKITGGIWKFIYQMPRMLTTAVVRNEDGSVKMEDGAAVTVDVPRFVGIGDAKHNVSTPDGVAKYRALKKEVRLRTTLAAQQRGTITPEWFVQFLAETFPTAGSYTYRVNKNSGAVTIVPGTADNETELSALDKLRQHARTFAAVLGLGGRSGLYYIDGLPSDKVESFIVVANTLGFDAALVTSNDEGIPGQLRITAKADGATPPEGN
jgi:hypothetical protein